MLQSAIHTFRFPGAASQTTLLSGVGLPGPYAKAGVLVYPSTSEATYKPSDGAEAARYAKLNLPKDLVAISIAPNSHIATCDLWLAGLESDYQRYQISTGNPFIGGSSPTSDFAVVSIPNSVPPISSGSAVPQLLFWDGADESVKRANDAGTTVGKVNGFPLRLEVWRASDINLRDRDAWELPRNIRRAPLVAHGVLVLDAGGVATGSLYVCVDGRRRIDIQVNSEDANGAGTIKAYAVEAFKQVGASVLGPNVDRATETQLALQSDGTMNVAVVANTTQIFSFNGNPITVLKVQITSTYAGSEAYQIRVMAWDD